jgi:hypothetical protein
VDNAGTPARKEWSGPLRIIRTGGESAGRLTAEANLEACRAMLALAAFRAETGGYPATLKEACVLSGLPVRREGNSYLLYSIGEDWRDDGGTPAGKRAGDGSGTGDLVWGGGRSAAGKSGPS